MTHDEKTKWFVGAVHGTLGKRFLLQQRTVKIILATSIYNLLESLPKTLSQTLQCITKDN